MWHLVPQAEGEEIFELLKGYFKDRVGDIMSDPEPCLCYVWFFSRSSGHQSLCNSSRLASLASKDKQLIHWGKDRMVVTQWHQSRLQRMR